MPYLGDFLGHILSEITIARIHADMEAVRVAEMYAGHSLLKHMPVPRFRVPDLTFDVPVVIKHLDEPGPEEPPRGAPSVEKVRKAFDKVLALELTRENINLTRDQKTRLKAALDERARRLEQPRGVSLDSTRMAGDMARETTRILTKPDRRNVLLDPGRARNFEAALKSAAHLEFVKLRTAPSRLQVLVTSAEIKEAGPLETITRIQIKIGEDAFERASVETEEGEQIRLVPE